MADLFPKSNQYDNQGAMMVNSSNIFEQATITVTLIGAANGIVPNMHDNDTSTVCGLTVGAGTGYAVWKFDGKPKFKNVFLTVYGDPSGGTTSCYLDGSNDNSSWTELGTVNLTGTSGVTKTITAATVCYKYLRARMVAAAGNSGVADIRGTI